MRHAMVILLLTFALSISACSGNKAAEIYETAKFEELQNNREHAGELYEEIVKKYPGSEYAKKAEERLSAMKLKETK